jgi:hypothetical protein
MAEPCQFPGGFGLERELAFALESYWHGAGVFWYFEEILWDVVRLCMEWPQCGCPVSRASNSGMEWSSDGRVGQEHSVERPDSLPGQPINPSAWIVMHILQLLLPEQP